MDRNNVTGKKKKGKDYNIYYLIEEGALYPKIPKDDIFRILAVHLLITGKFYPIFRG